MRNNEDELGEDFLKFEIFRQLRKMSSPIQFDSPQDEFDFTLNNAKNLYAWITEQPITTSTLNVIPLKKDK